jgi:hypothetical protein
MPRDRPSEVSLGLGKRRIGMGYDIEIPTQYLSTFPLKMHFLEYSFRGPYLSYIL